MPSVFAYAWGGGGRPFALIILVLLSTPFSQAFANSRVALVVGNSSYERISALTNPANDAALMSETLRDLGFEVVEARDVDRVSFGEAIQEFGRKLRAAGTDAVGLFFYAGHGVQAQGANYLIPIGARIETEADLAFEAVSAQWVLAQMEFAGNALNIVILDACRNNPFEGGFRSLTRGLARMDAPRGSLVAYAAAPGQVASDGSSDNSPYTAALAAAMVQPGVDLEDVFKQVRVAVEDATGGAQTPWEESSLRGDFYFRPPAEEVALTTPETQNQIESAPKQVARSDFELAFWEAIKSSENPASFEAYLAQFPEGVFAPLAEVKLAELNTKESSAPTRQTETTTEPSTTDGPVEQDQTQVAALPNEQEADPDAGHRAAEMSLGLTSSQRQEAQRALTVLGYNTGGADGLLGPNSRAAIAAYQIANGQDGTGYFTAALHEKLMEEAAGPLAELAAEEQHQREAEEAAAQQQAAQQQAASAAQQQQQQQAAAPAETETSANSTAEANAGLITALEVRLESLQNALAAAQAGGGHPFDGTWSGNVTKLSGSTWGRTPAGAFTINVEGGQLTTSESGNFRMRGTVSEGGVFNGISEIITQSGEKRVDMDFAFSGDSGSGEFVAESWSLTRFGVSVTRQSAGRSGDQTLINEYNRQIEDTQAQLRALRGQ